MDFIMGVIAGFFGCMLLVSSVYEDRIKISDVGKFVQAGATYEQCFKQFKPTEDD